MGAPKNDYYTGDLEKKFNYFWEGGTWSDFVDMVAQVDSGKLRPGYVRRQFYSTNTDRVVHMSANAYSRWVRSLKHQQSGKVA